MRGRKLFRLHVDELRPYSVFREIIRRFAARQPAAYDAHRGRGSRIFHSESLRTPFFLKTRARQTVFGGTLPRAKTIGRGKSGKVRFFPKRRGAKSREIPLFFLSQAGAAACNRSLSKRSCRLCSLPASVFTRRRQSLPSRIRPRRSRRTKAPPSRAAIRLRKRKIRGQGFDERSFAPSFPPPFQVFPL